MKHLKHKLFMVAVVVLAAGAIYMVAYKMMNKQDVKVQLVQAGKPATEAMCGDKPCTEQSA